MKRLLLFFALILLIAAAGLLVPLRTVASDEMAWTLRPGDYIWVIPGTVFKGDVVVINDPLDPDRTVLRRVVALPGEKIKYQEGSFRVNGKRVRQSDVNEGGEPHILKEVIWSRPPARATRWFVTQDEEPGAWQMEEPITIPAGHIFVLADNRDKALDSRWWGPIPAEAVRGVVRARYGPADPQRETAIEWVRPIDQPTVEEKDAELIEERQNR